MGSFYTNITLRTDRHDDVVAELRDKGRDAFVSASTSGMEAVLRGPNAAAGGEGYVFESERHQALVEALGTPTIAVQTGFNYIEEGELPEDVDMDSLTRV